MKSKIMKKGIEHDWISIKEKHIKQKRKRKPKGKKTIEERSVVYEAN